MNDFIQQKERFDAVDSMYEHNMLKIHLTMENWFSIHFFVLNLCNVYVARTKFSRAAFVADWLPNQKYIYLEIY